MCQMWCQGLRVHQQTHSVALVESQASRGAQIKPVPTRVSVELLITPTATLERGCLILPSQKFS